MRQLPLIQRFCDHLDAERNFSAHTVRSYAADLEQFCRFLAALDGLAPAGRGGADPSALTADDLPRIDFVLVSHNHYDHLDVETLSRLAKRDPHTLFVVPLENDGRLLGAAYADSDDAGRVFTDLDAELLGAFATQASLVLAAGALDEQLARMQSLVAVAPNGATQVAGQAPAFPGRVPPS